jgi:hypothetical protein
MRFRGIPVGSADVRYVGFRVAAGLTQVGQKRPATPEQWLTVREQVERLEIGLTHSQLS